MNHIWWCKNSCCFACSPLNLDLFGMYITHNVENSWCRKKWPFFSKFWPFFSKFWLFFSKFWQEFSDWSEFQPALIINQLAPLDAAEILLLSHSSCKATIFDQGPNEKSTKFSASKVRLLSQINTQYSKKNNNNNRKQNKFKFFKKKLRKIPSKSSE